MRICAIHESDALTITKRPNVLVEIGKEYKLEYALFDTGADINSLSYESWVAIGKPTLQPSSTTFKSFVGETNPVEGFLDLAIFIGQVNVHHIFYVMKPGKVMTPVILGQPWQRTYNGVPHWRKEGITYEKDGLKFFAPFLDEDCYTSDDEPADEESHKEKEFTTPAEAKNKGQPDITPINIPEEEPTSSKVAHEVCNANPVHAPAFNNKATHKQGNKSNTLKKANAIWIPKKLRQAQEGQTHIWVPKKSQQQTTPTQKSPNKPTRKSTNKHSNATSSNKQTKEQAGQERTQLKWVPKTLLRAQGFYEGATHVWLPKPLHKPTTQSSQEAPTPQSQTRYRWVPKQTTTNPAQQPQVKESAHKARTQPRRATIQAKGKWIPKQPRQPEAMITNHTPSTSASASTNPQEEQAAKTKVTNHARQLAFLLMTFKREVLVKLGRQRTTYTANNQHATSTPNATGSYMLQYPPLAQH